METLEKTVLQKVRETIRETEPEKEADAMGNRTYVPVYLSKKAYFIRIGIISAAVFLLIVGSRIYDFLTYVPSYGMKIETIWPYVVALSLILGIVYPTASAQRLKEKKILYCIMGILTILVITNVGLMLDGYLKTALPYPQPDPNFAQMIW